VIEEELVRGRADAESQKVRLLEGQGQVARIELAAKTANLFLDNLFAQAWLELSGRRLDTAENAVSILERQVEAGSADRRALGMAKLDAQRAKLTLTDAQHELAIARRQLTAQWGLSEPGFERVKGEWQSTPPLPGFEVLLAAVESSPLLMTLASERRVAEASLVVAELQQKPRWQLNAGVRHFAQSNDYAFVAGFNLPLPSEQRFSARAAQARAEMARADADQAARQVELETVLFAQYTAMEHSLHVYEAMTKQLIPTLNEMIRITEEGYERGRYEFEELRQLQEEMWMLQREQIEAAINAQRYWISIQRLTGAILPASSYTPTEAN
jgi:cobalt-zinc-cadmium efflux system outer membrane protein